MKHLRKGIALKISIVVIGITLLGITSSNIHFGMGSNEARQRTPEEMKIYSGVRSTKDLDSSQVLSGSLFETSNDLNSSCETDAKVSGTNPYIGGTVELNGGEFKCRVLLHQCNLGCESCRTGGSIEILKGNQLPIISGDVTLFAKEGENNYQLNWSEKNVETSKAQKIEFLSKLVSHEHPPTVAEFKKLTRQLYGFEMSPIDHDEMLKQLAMSIISSVVFDQRRVLDDQFKN